MTDIFRDRALEAIKRCGSRSAWARELGVTAPFVTHMMNGFRTPTTRVLKNLDLRLEVTERIVHDGADRCPRCDGSGHGRRYTTSDMITMILPCTECGGTGRIKIE